MDRELDRDVDQESSSVSSATWMLGGLALGAVVMFMTDPERGRRRREMAADTLQNAMESTTDYLGSTARDLGSRAEDISDQARDMLPDTRSNMLSRSDYRRMASAGNSSLWMVGGAALGALAMYLADPELGRRRRAMANDKLRSASASTKKYMTDTSRDLGSRTSGLLAQARNMVPALNRDSTELKVR